MSPVEAAAIRELRDEIEALRNEVREEVHGIKTSVAPAVRLAANVEIAGDILAGTARFVKWGVGIGAGFATVVLALKATGVL